MLTKIVIIFMLFAIIFALAVSLYFLIKNQNDNNQTVKALTWRIVITIALILFILTAYHFGWIHPNDVFFTQKASS